MTYEQILNDLKRKVYYPVYFLHGDEAYYIDKISDFITENILTESEKEFNQSILYGKDLDVPTLMSYAKRYPMMSNHQVVMVREAQDLKNLLPKENKKDEKDFMIEYLQNPLKSTILVLCYKYKTIDKRTKLAKVLDKTSVLFESKKIYENKLPEWINKFVQEQGFKINPKATMMLAEYLGNDLTKITNELEKLMLSLLPSTEISVNHIEENIGISKDFNVFELNDALGTKNVFKANQIVNYFASNTKNNPLVFTIPQLFSYFLKVLKYHTLKGRPQNEVASALGVNPYFIRDYESAAKSYSTDKVIKIISSLREYDAKSKGVDNTGTDDGSLLKELVYKILH
jgi:DNA polymerase-3 subunit delta